MKNCLNFLERELRGTANELDLGTWENSKTDPESAFLPAMCLLHLSMKLEFSLAAPICILCSGGRALIFATDLYLATGGKMLRNCFMENHSKLKPNSCYFIEIIFSLTDTSIL